MENLDNYDEELDYFLALLKVYNRTESEIVKDNTMTLISNWFDDNAIYIAHLDITLHQQINQILDDGTITDEEYDALNDYITIYLQSHQKQDFAKIKETKQRISKAEIAAIKLNDELDKDFVDKVVVITGNLSRYPIRKEAEMEVRKRGGKTANLISGMTNILICGNGAGPSKIMQVKQRREQGQDIKLVDEETFYKMLKNNEAID